MSRLRTGRVALGLGMAGLLCAGLAAADSFDDLKARGRAATEPNEAIQASRALRRAGLVSDAIKTVGRVMGKAKDNDTIAALHLELARGSLDQHQQKKALHECDPSPQV